MDKSHREPEALLSRRMTQAFALFAIIAGFFLIVEHRAHVIPYLPWLFLLACPLMHLFMHHGHGGHHHGGDGRSGGPDAKSVEADAELPVGSIPHQSGGQH